METKGEVRARVRARRRELHSGEHSFASLATAQRTTAAAFDWLESLGRDVTEVLLYLPSNGEPDTFPLVHSLWGLGIRVWAPVCLPENKLAWTQWKRDSGFQPSEFARVLEPVGMRISSVDLLHEFPLGAMFLPAVAVDTDGNRLGNGGGYYDRFLAQAGQGARHIPRAVLLNDGEILPSNSFPVEETDLPVDAAITAVGVTFFNSESTSGSVTE